MYTLFAHVKWFVEDNRPVPELNSVEWLGVATGVLAGTLLLFVAHQILIRLGVTQRLDRSLGKLNRAIPYIVRYTSGLLFVINAAKGLLFAPNVPTSAHDIGPLLSVLLAAAGVALIVGFKVRWAAVVILGVYLTALLFIRPFGDIVDHIEYIGIGLYLLLYNYQPYLAFVGRRLRQAILSPESLLRIFVGVGLMSLALTEKLVGIELSANFLQLHNWNFLEPVGINDRTFIIISGITEFVVGLTLVLNIAPRLTTAIVALLMTITAILLGVEEVFGHLFALSLVAVVWLRKELPSTVRPKRH